MQLHTIQPNTKNKSRKRVGRGGKRGTYSGRGIKGQRARAGRKIRPAVRDLIQRTPKLRGAGDKAARYRKGRQKVKSARQDKKQKASAGTKKDA